MAEVFPDPIDIREQAPFREAAQTVCDLVQANQRAHFKGILIIPSQHQKELIKHCRPEHVTPTLGDGDHSEERGNLFLELNGVVRIPSRWAETKFFGPRRKRALRSNYRIPGDEAAAMLADLTAEQKVLFLQYAFANRFHALENTYTRLSSRSPASDATKVDQLFRMAEQLDEFPQHFHEAIERLIPTGL